MSWVGYNFEDFQEMCFEKDYRGCHLTNRCLCREGVKNWKFHGILTSKCPQIKLIKNYSTALKLEMFDSLPVDAKQIDQMLEALAKLRDAKSWQ